MADWPDRPTGIRTPGPNRRRTNPSPSRVEIVAHMNGNICRCGTYTRIVAAIERAAAEG